jgi:signal peptidase
MKKFLRNAAILLVAVAAIAGIIAFKSVFTLVSIEGGSMEPTLPVSTLVLVKSTDTLKPTDIITFKQDTDTRATTHTFIGYEADGSLRTKGDANETPDMHDVPLQMSDVAGKVVLAIPFLVPSYWSSIQGVLSLIIIGMMVIAIIIVTYRSKQEEQKENATQREETLELTPSNL